MNVITKADELYMPQSPETKKDYNYEKDLDCINKQQIKRKSNHIINTTTPTKKQICIYGNEYNILKNIDTTNIFLHKNVTLEYKSNENICIDVKNTTNMENIEKDNEAMLITPSITERISIKYYFNLDCVP